MCGIYGFSRVTDITRRMSPFLALAMEERGKDSWGATDGIEVIKQLGPVHKTYAEEIPQWAEWSQAIFHMRAASTGKVSIDNQHPFVVRKDRKIIIGIHNGIVTNYDILNKKYNRTYECDSPHIFEAIVGNSSTNEIQGYGNLAWYEITDETQKPKLHLARFNGDNLNIASLESGEIVFCSTREIVERAALMAGGKVRVFFATDGDFEYCVKPLEENPTQDGLFKVGRLPFGSRQTPYQGNTSSEFAHWRGGTNDYTSYRPVYPTLDKLNAKDREQNICAISSCLGKCKPSRRKALVCDVCMAKIAKELEGTAA